MQRRVRHVDTGHVAEFPSLGDATQKADRTTVRHHENARFRRYLRYLVERASQALMERLEGLGLEVATSDEAREILDLKGGDKLEV